MTTIITLPVYVLTGLYSIAPATGKKPDGSGQRLTTSVLFTRSGGVVRAVSTDKYLLSRFACLSEGEDFAPVALSRTLVEKFYKELVSHKPDPKESVELYIRPHKGEDTWTLFYKDEPLAVGRFPSALELDFERVFSIPSPANFHLTGEFGDISTLIMPITTYRSKVEGQMLAPEVWSEVEAGYTQGATHAD